MSDQFWILVACVGGCFTVIGFFLKHLFHKVENSVSRAEFNKAMEIMRADHTTNHQSLREDIIKLLDRQDIQRDMLTRVMTRIEVFAELNHFGTKG